MSGQYIIGAPSHAGGGAGKNGGEAFDSNISPDALTFAPPNLASPMGGSVRPYGRARASSISFAVARAPKMRAKAPMRGPCS